MGFQGDVVRLHPPIRELSSTHRVGLYASGDDDACDGGQAGEHSPLKVNDAADLYTYLCFRQSEVKHINNLCCDKSRQRSRSFPTG